MTLSLLVKPNAPSTQKGLDALVDHLQTGGTLGDDWAQWLQAAFGQLEADNTIDAHRADNLADTLSEMEEQLTEGYDATQAVQRLLSLYSDTPSLEELWRDRAENLLPAQLQTTLWSDLHRALAAVESGRHQVVSRWIDLVENRMLARWDDYENLELLDEEVTCESVAGHHILCDGLEGWLCALAELRHGLGTGFVNRQGVLESAEIGQRLLVTLENVQKESVSPLDWLVEAWRN
jgi:hypothetical protein